MLHDSNPLNVCGQWILHRPTRFERRQNRVEVHRRATEDLVAQRIRECIQNRAASTAHWRLANTASTNGRFRISNVERRPLHVDRNIENGWWLGMVEAQRYGASVMGIVNPLLADR